MKLDNGTIFLRDVSDLGGKIVQVELDPMSILAADDTGSENGQCVYPQIQYINGVPYIVTNQVDGENDLWELDNELLKKKEETAVKKSTEIKYKTTYVCPREGCNKVYSSVHHLKVSMCKVLQ